MKSCYIAICTVLYRDGLVNTFVLMKYGLLLINLGTPDSPDSKAVRHYLREFLADRRVIDLPAPLRYLLLYGVILPFRPRKSAHAYQAIWTEEGSPLLVHSQDLLKKLQARLSTHCKVALGMRYGNPSIDKALAELQACEHICVLPLYPQYSSAATGSSIAHVMQLLAQQSILPSLSIVRDFHQHPGFIQAQAELIAPHLATHDYILFSYHGVPEKHLLKNHCKDVCISSCSPASLDNQSCYRAQCLRTSASLAKHLGLTDTQYSTSFQSRLGRTPWIQPYTDKILQELVAQGVKNLAVACPSFVADCLETLEEIGMRARKQWLDLGGVQLTLVPCINDSERWVDAIIDIASIQN